MFWRFSNRLRALQGKDSRPPMPATTSLISLPGHTGLAAAILAVAGFSAVAAFWLGRRELIGRAALESSGTSLGFYAVNALLAVWKGLLVVAVLGLYHRLGLPMLSHSWWQAIPAWLAVLIVVISIDVQNYAAHRWLHGRIGWPIHAIHHSDPHVNGLTAYRVHFLELVVMRLFAIALFGWLGTPPAVLGAAIVIALLYDLYVHTDTDIEHGPLRFILASPRFHRWHHYDDPAAYTTNLAGMFSLLDVIFGTYRNPVRIDAQVGAATAGVPGNDLVKLLLFPFAEWGRMISARRRNHALNG